MKLGLLADIHENVELLDLALDRLRGEAVDRLIFLGDLVEANTRLDEVAGRLAAESVVGVWGNHEFGLCWEPTEAIRRKYAGPGLDFLSTLAPQLEVAGCRFSHVLPHHDPTDVMQPWYVEGPPTTAADAAPLFAAAPQRVMFGGHYHRWLAIHQAEGPLPWYGLTPLRLEPPGRWFVIVHAVCNGWCATYDTEAAMLTPIPLFTPSRRAGFSLPTAQPIDPGGRQAEACPTDERQTEACPADGRQAEACLTDERQTEACPTGSARNTQRAYEPEKLGDPLLPDPDPMGRPGILPPGEGPSVESFPESGIPRSAILESGIPEADGPDALLDCLRDHPEWDEPRREAVLDRLVARFPADRLRDALRGRWHELGESHGDALLQLAEVLATDELLADLASALVAIGDDLPPERTWEALAVLQGTGLIEAHPELAERMDELAEAIEADEASIEELAAQLEEDPDGIWTALHGLGPVEPEVRAAILDGLARQPPGPGLVEFLRLLAHGHEPTTARAALETLLALNAADPLVAAALARLATEHPDPAISNRAAEWLREQAIPPVRSEADARHARPRIIASRLSALDAAGRGAIGLAADGEYDGRAAVAAVFLCDLTSGIVDVGGLITDDAGEAVDFLRESADAAGSSVAIAEPGPVLGLLAAVLTLCGPATTPALGFWLERTAGPGFRPRPFALAAAPGGAPASIPHDAMPTCARAVLEAYPDWVDDSDLTYEIAEELLLREGGARPDPLRDAGAFRFLFEGRLRHRVELDLRMLAWMATFWDAAGEDELARSAAALAGQLADAQHVVPGHPYLVELAARSLAAAQDDLRRGVDLRDPAARARRVRVEWP